MMLEGPVVQGAIGRLPDPPLNLAAWGLTMSLSLLIESPIIMLLATAIALVKDGPSFRALRRFMVTLCIGCTAITGLIAFTPLFEVLAGDLMGQPAAIVAAARPAMGMMLLWSAAIAWRRFYQGVLVRHDRTRFVSWGTAIRLGAAVSAAVGLARGGQLPGAQVGACALMIAVLTEAVVTTLFARPIVHREVLPREGPPLTQRAIFRFHAPLAATTLLTLLAQPLTGAALARLERPVENLAALPVAYMLLLVIRGGGLALQEIAVAQARCAAARPTLKRFTWIVGGVSSGVTALIAFTPLLDAYLLRLLDLPASLHSYVRVGVGAGLFLPLLTALGSRVRGVLVLEQQTQAVYRGMCLNLATHAALLGLSVPLRLPGMWAAALAFTLAALAEYLYLLRVLRRHERRPVLTPVA
jgi:hypothetical protein